MARCAGITRSGDQCTAGVSPGETWCYGHDPTRADERRRAAARAGRSRSNGEILELKTRLREVAAGTLAGSIDPRRGAVVVQAYNAMSRVIELERRWRELDEISARIDALERRTHAI